MVHNQQLAWLRQGVEIWNKWRKENPDTNIDLNDANLSNANLSGTDLSRADLSRADLSRADLSNANLSNANLREANLSNANLSKANLSEAFLLNANLGRANLCEAILSKAFLLNASVRSADLRLANLRNTNLFYIQAVEANFSQANMTGACIQDWHINSETNFESAKCDYIFRSYDQNKFLDRLPVSPRQKFKPGEFEEWIKISSEAQQTIDLTFTEGIDWQAFFQSLQEVREKYPDSEVGLQAIEEKGTAFVIRLKTALDTDQSAIESTYKEIYQEKLFGLEQKYKVELLAKDKEIEIQKKLNTDLTEIARILASRPILVEATAVAETNKTSVNTQTIGVMHTGSGDVKQFSQCLGSKADEINQLISSLRKLSQSLPEEPIKIQEQKEIIEGELDDLEHDIKTPENHQPKRIRRRLKGLLAAGTAVATIAGSAATGAVDLSKKANDFTGNVIELADKLGIELVQTTTRNK